MLYTVGEPAKKMQLEPATLRYYDKEGLLPSVERSGGGIRIFKEDLGWLATIECLKRPACSSAKSGTLWAGACRGRDDPAAQGPDRKEARGRARAAAPDAADAGYARIQKRYYETAEAAGACKVHDSLGEADIPENLRRGYAYAKGGR